VLGTQIQRNNQYISNQTKANKQFHFPIRTSFKKMMETIMVWQKAKARQMSAFAMERIGLSAPDELFPMLTCKR